MFWKNFKQICEEHNKKPTQVVVDLGLSRSLVTSWKNGGYPRTKTIKRIAEYFNVPVLYFFAVPSPDQQSAPERSKEMFIEKLTELMKSRNVTRAQLAAAVGIGINQIKYWETHGNMPNADVLRRIADYFGVSVQCFFEVTAENQQSDAKLSEQEFQAINKDRNMTPMEAWGIISANLMELYKCKRTETFKGYTDADLEAEVLCFKALREMYERSEGKCQK